jgi:cysteinyl-tRNA synthetase
VFKDGVMERMKETHDALTQAEDTFTIRQDLNNISERMLRIEMRMNAASGKQDYSESISQETEFLEQAQQNLETMVDTTTLLFEKLPVGAEKFRPAIEALQEKTANVRKVVNQLKDLAEGEPSPKALETSKTLLGNIVKVREIITPLATMALALGREQEQLIDDLYPGVRRISYTLFLIGWLLALIGILDQEIKRSEDAQGKK